ncbi:MAG: hypothetical protein J7K75_01025 [Desulfuromonas sp.]|nr:hypothetical protein [Desulfuromonas sp.]
MLNTFWRQLATAKKAILMLDYDGTLAPFRVEREQAVPYPGVRELLTAIQADTETRLVIISGRAIDDLLPLLAFNPPPEIWGCHGWERLDAFGQRLVAQLPVQAALGLQKAQLRKPEPRLLLRNKTHLAGIPLARSCRSKNRATSWAS